jgi:hypothetical protein
MEMLISAELTPSTLAQKILLIFSTLLLAAELLNAAASEAVTAYLAVLPVIVVGDLRFGAAIRTS